MFITPTNDIFMLFLIFIFILFYLLWLAFFFYIQYFLILIYFHFPKHLTNRFRYLLWNNQPQLESILFIRSLGNSEKLRMPKEI